MEGDISALANSKWLVCETDELYTFILDRHLELRTCSFPPVRKPNSDLHNQPTRVWQFEMCKGRTPEPGMIPQSPIKAEEVAVSIPWYLPAVFQEGRAQGPNLRVIFLPSSIQPPSSQIPRARNHPTPSPKPPALRPAILSHSLHPTHLSTAHFLAA